MNRSVAINKLSRLCLEEHIRNEKPDGCGNEYHLTLMEPMKTINRAPETDTAPI